MSTKSPQLSIPRDSQSDLADVLKEMGFDTEPRAFRHPSGDIVQRFTDADGHVMLTLHDGHSSRLFREEMSSIDSPVMTTAEFLNRKPDVNSAHDMLAFAKAGDADVVWLDETQERSMQVTHIMGIGNDDTEERLDQIYGNQR